MKVRVKREDLLEAVSALRGICAENRIITAYRHIFLLVEENSLFVAATDGEQAAKFLVPAEIEEAGTGNVHGQKLYSLLRALNCDYVEIESYEEKSFIRYPGGTVQSAAYDIDTAPWKLPEEITTLAYLRYPYGQFVGAVDAVKHATASKKDRPILQSVCLEVSRNQGLFIATDARLLSVWEMPFTGDIFSDEPIRVVIPSDILPTIHNLFNNRETLITVYDNVLEIEAEGRAYWTRLLDGDYPNVQELLNNFAALESHAFTVRVNKRAMEDAVKHIAAFGLPESISVGLTITEDLTMEIRSSSMVSSSTETIDIIEINNIDNMRAVDSPYLIFLNTKYLLDTINSFHPEPMELYLRFLTPIDGVVITDAELGLDFGCPRFTIVMPMRHEDMEATNKYIAISNKWKKEVAKMTSSEENESPKASPDVSMERYPSEEELP
jgi:DNA polymerase III sliding clamp (beta) subunit (PCNA family)